MVLFQFTPLREGRPSFPICWNCCRTFQFTPLREGRRDLLHLTGGNKIFQFTPLREGRRRKEQGRRCRTHFNSRPSARGDEAASVSALKWTISIHAPPRGATRNYATQEVNLISIHAPPRGATDYIDSLVWVGDFNSRPSARGDTVGSEVVGGAIAISIHAPPRGATPYLPAGRCSARNFNSRPSARGDGDARKQPLWFFLFQFTPLREGRHGLLPRWLRWDCYFNSRPSARGDGIPVMAGVWRSISIHAPPRGATSGCVPEPARIAFQFTPLREGRRCTPRTSTLWRNFNSRPSARGDGKRYAISANLLFNPYKSAWLNNSATQFVEIILVIFHRIIA